jgi:hypothetical protein
MENEDMSHSVISALTFSFAMVISQIGYAETTVVTNAKHAILTFELTAEKMDLSKLMRFRSEDGQFEVRIKPSQFPVPAPHCRSAIIARMPSTLGRDQAEIAKKKRLFELIQSAQSEKTKTVEIKLDLKPYVKIKRSQPFEGELEHCNVFFAPLSDQPSLAE